MKLHKEKRPERFRDDDPEEWFFHQDNAPAHKSGDTMLWLDLEEFKLLIQSPYSPDLAPCDFWAFPVLKRRLAGQKSDTDEEMITAVRTEFARMCKEGGKDGKEVLGHVMDMWEKRLRKVIAVNGDYIEK